MQPNPQFPADFVIFTEEILNGKFYFLCSKLRNNLSEKSKRLLDVNIEKGVSYWLTTLPISDFGFGISK